MEDEIDLRPYIMLLLHSWYWIAGVALLAVLVAWLASSLRPDEYIATASVAIVRSRTDVSFDPRIVDVVENDLVRTDLNSRRQALIALVSSNDIALQVLDDLGDGLPLEKRSVDSLLKMVEADNQGDLLNIMVHSTDPQVAASVANAWAEHYEDLVNNLYGGSSAFGADNLSAQVELAAATYDLAQQDVESFIASNRIVTLEGEIAAQQQLLDSNRLAIAAVQVKPMDLQTDAKQNVLFGYYNMLQETELWLTDARALQDLLNSNSTSTGTDLANMLTLIGLQNRAFGAETAVSDLRIDLATENLEPVQARDVEAIIVILEERQALLLEQIHMLTQSWVAETPQHIDLPQDHPLNLSVATLEQKFQTLQAELESQKAQQRELQQRRDLTWETYETLTRKMTEEEIAAQTKGTEVLFAEQAVAPREPSNTSRLQIMVVAGGFGSIAAVFAVFIIAWWRQNCLEDESLTNIPRGSLTPLREKSPL